MIPDKTDRSSAKNSSKLHIPLLTFSLYEPLHLEVSLNEVRPSGGSTYAIFKSQVTSQFFPQVRKVTKISERVSICIFWQQRNKQVKRLTNPLLQFERFSRT